MSRRGERGLVLPLAILLGVILSISGASFMHHDYLERLMALTNVENQSAFYLANTGIERAREALKLSGTTWTAQLTGTGIAGNQASCGTQLLCPDLSRGCLVPPFGALVTSASINPLGFGASFNQGSYTVRAFNNLNDPGGGTNDTDRKLTVRSCGIIRNEQKLLEATALTVSCGLITCTDPNSSVANCLTENGAPDLTTHHIDGCGPRALPADQMPFLDPPLSDPSNLYRDPTHFGLTEVSLTGDMVLTKTPDPGKPEEVRIENDRYYYATGNILVKDTASDPTGNPNVPNGNKNIVIFSEKDVTLKTGGLADTVIVGVNQVSLQGGSSLDAPPTYPAVIAGSAVHADANVSVFGTIYSMGTIDLNPIVVHGAIIGQIVEVQGGAGTLYTDDGSLTSYELLQGFNYPNQSQQLKVTGQSWRELQ